MIEKRHVRWIPAVLALVGAALRIRAYVENASLSIDEAAIARNLAARPLAHIFGPLDYAQIAPPGFLLFEKLAIATLGQSEYALRAAPLVFSLLSLWLCWSLAKRILPFSSAAGCLALVALNTALIAYAVVAKPYSGEVAAALFVVWLGVRLIDDEREAGRLFWPALAGAATVLIAFTAVFVLAASAATFVGQSFSTQIDGSRRSRLRSIAAAWGAAAIGGIWLGRLNLSASDAEYMHWFWASGFMPFPPRTGHDALWVWAQMKSLFGQTGHYRAATAWLLLAAAGGYSLWRRRPITAAIVLAPLLLVLLASAARLYPFASGRLQLFLLPLLLLAAAEGARWTWSVTPRRARLVGILPAAVLLLSAGYSTVTQPGREPREEIRPFLQRVVADWRTGDVLYVYHGLGQAFLYYAPRYRFTEADYVLGTCSRGSGRTYLQELDRLRGRPRVWVALPHTSDIETDLFVRYLDAVGRRLESGGDEGTGAGSVDVGYLYDLSESGRGMSVTAGSFVLPERLSNPAPYPWSCYGVFQPIAGERAGAE